MTCNHTYIHAMEGLTFAVPDDTKRAFYLSGRALPAR